MKLLLSAIVLSTLAPAAFADSVRCQIRFQETPTSQEGHTVADQTTALTTAAFAVNVTGASEPKTFALQAQGSTEGGGAIQVAFSEIADGTPVLKGMMGGSFPPGVRTGLVFPMEAVTKDDKTYNFLAAGCIRIPE